MPGAVIDGYEMQEELIDCLQAMVGYQAAPPYGALAIVGSGGVLVELEADKALSLSPVTAAEAGAMLAGTRLGKTLDGYRNLVSPDRYGAAGGLVAHLSELAADFCRPACRNATSTRCWSARVGRRPRRRRAVRRGDPAALQGQ